MLILFQITGPLTDNDPESMVHGANMGPIWDRQDPGGPHVGPMDLVIWGQIAYTLPPLYNEKGYSYS